MLHENVAEIDSELQGLHSPRLIADRQLGQPARVTVTVKRAVDSIAVWAVFACLLGFIVTISVVILWLGSLPAAMAWAAGESVYARVVADNSSQSAIQLTNLTSSPINVYGVRTQCSCVVVSNIPREIPSHTTAEWILKAERPNVQAPAGVVHFFTDAAGARDLKVHVGN